MHNVVKLYKVMCTMKCDRNHRNMAMFIDLVIRILFCTYKPLIFTVVESLAICVGIETFEAC